MLYITGNVYLKSFKNEIIGCLKNNCEIKLLLVSTDSNNINFVHSLENTYGIEKDEFVNQIDDVKNLVSDLNKTTNSNKIKIRFYQDEYFYNFRSAKYYDSKTDTILCKSNINIQPFNKPAVDCSIGLSGTYKNNDTDLGSNIFYQNDQTFDKLWEKYKDTEFICENDDNITQKSI